MEGIKTEHKEVAKGTLWSLVGMFAIKFSSFIYTIILARMFTLGDVGTFNLALSIMYPLSILADWGINSAFGRFVPYYYGKGDKKKVNGLLKTAYTASGLTSFLFMVGLFVFSGPIADYFGNSDLQIALQTLGVFLFVFTFFTLNSSFLLSMKNVKDSNVVQNIQNLLKLVLTLAFVFIIGPTIYAICAGFLLSYIIGAVISFYYTNNELKKKEITDVPLSLKQKVSILKEIVPFGLMLALVTMFWALATNVDKIMLGTLLPLTPLQIAETIAVYSMALSLVTLIAVFPSAITSILLPLMSEMHGKKKNKETIELSSSVVRWNTFLLVPLTILLIAFPSEILGMIYGQNYASGGIALMVLSVGMFIKAMSTVHGTLLASRRIVSVEMGSAILAMTINVLLNWIMIPSYGMAGAAFASAVSFLAVSCLLIYYSKKIAGFGFSIEFFRPIIAGFVALILLIIAKDQVIIISENASTLIPEGTEMGGMIMQKLVKLIIFGALFLLACIIYGLILLITKGFGKQDFELLSTALKKGKMPEAWLTNVQNRFGGEYV